MVSHSHLSAGNSVSSHSRDIFADYGVSAPSSSSESPLAVSSNGLVEAEVNMNLPSLVPNSDDMVESEINPHTVGISSEESTSLDRDLDVHIGPALGTEAQDIFKAAQYFSRMDRVEALEERKRNSQLLDFISAHGLSLNDANAYVSEGKLAPMVNAQKLSGSGLVTNARKVFDESPLKDAGPSSPQRGSPLFLGGSLVPVACVGEELVPERVPQSPLISPVKFGFPPGNISKSNSNLNSNCLSR